MKIVQEVSLISVGSFEESSDWSFLAIFVIEHDQVDSNVPTITKGTDGRALV